LFDSRMLRRILQRMFQLRGPGVAPCGPQRLAVFVWRGWRTSVPAARRCPAIEAGGAAGEGGKAAHDT